jgi:hypothetical protein
MSPHFGVFVGTVFVLVIIGCALFAWFLVALGRVIVREYPSPWVRVIGYLVVALGILFTVLSVGFAGCGLWALGQP